MDKVIARLLSGVRLGEPRAVQGVTLIPVFSRLPKGPAYETLAEAISAGTLVVSEVDEAGAVPRVKARNLGAKGVLCVDGEELSGARQNRVLNTSVFLPARSEVIIPVSCVEAGRWNERSKAFADSGYVAAASVRQMARRSVTANLRAGDRFDSDQGGVWGEVDRLAHHQGVISDTRAMRDVFEAGRERVDAAVDELPPADGQAGLVAVQEGSIRGFDVISRPAAYAVLHGRLVRSYLYEAPDRAVNAPDDDLKAAKEFLVSLADLDSSQHESPGAGFSHRFTGGRVAGEALCVDDTLLHAGFFEESEPGLRIGEGFRRYRSGLGRL